jgi:hypothetical protein
MFIVALFTITMLQNQQRCPSVEERVKKMWGTYTIEYYSSTKKNKIMSCAQKSMELQTIMLRKIHQTQKDQYQMFSLICEI